MDHHPNFAHRPHISVFGPECSGDWALLNQTQGGFGSAVFPAANRALYFPMAIWTPYTVTKCFWYNGTTGGGNVDIGVYSMGGARLLSLGSTAQGTASTVVSATLGSAFLLTPGMYYLAFACNSGTATFQRQIPGVQFCKAMGWAEQATAFALPATATFATSTSNYRPMFGIGNYPTI
jgi:hypothetical protein